MSAARRRRPKWVAPVVALGVLAVVIVVAAYFVFFAGSSSASKYQTAQATTETLSVTVSGSGNAAATRTTSVNPTVSGTVYDLRVSLGSRVTKGQVVFKIKSSSVVQSLAQQEASLKQSQQQLASAKLSLMQADQKLDQLEEQTRTPAPTEDDFEVARQQVKVAKKGLKTANAQLESAQVSYDQAQATADARTIWAPMTGYVTTLNVTSGGSSGGSGSTASGSSGSGAGGTSSSSSSSSNGNSSSAALVISDLSSIDIPVSINEANISSVRIGQKATVTFDALPDLTLTGQVQRIAQQGTTSSGVVSYGVTIELDMQDPKVKPGMSCTAEITTAIAKDAVTVPNGAVKSDSQGTYVQVLAAPTGQPQRVDVATGLANDTRTQIKSGLKVGQTVVTGSLSSTGSSTTGTRSNQRGGFGIFGGGPGGGR